MIIKERLNTLIVEKARERCSHYDSNAVAGACIFEFRLYDLLDFANALLKAVEQELEVIEHLYTYTNDYGEVVTDISIDRPDREFTSVQLIALPLVESEE